MFTLGFLGLLSFILGIFGLTLALLWALRNYRSPKCPRCGESFYIRESCSPYADYYCCSCGCQWLL